MKYRKKPVVIEAEQFTEENKLRAFNFIACHHWADWDANQQPIIKIGTLEGDMTASMGDWIIKGVKGEFYPCKPDIFAATYEAVIPTPAQPAATPRETPLKDAAHAAGVLAGNPQAEIDVLRLVLTESEQQRDARLAECIERRKDAKAHACEMKDMREERDAARQEVEGLEGENDSLRTKLGSILFSGVLDKEMAGTVQGWVTSYESSLRTQLSAAQSRIVELSETCHGLSGETVVQAQELASLTEKLARVERERDELKGLWDTQRQTIESYQRHLEESCSDLTAARQQAETDKATIAELMHERDDLKIEVSQLSAEVGPLYGDRDSLRSQLTQREKEAEGMRRALEEAHQTLGDAPELNMQNYSEDQVSMLNQFVIAVHKIITAALTQPPEEKKREHEEMPLLRRNWQSHGEPSIGLGAIRA